MIAVRPQVGTEVLSALKFRADHRIISLMAITPLDTVAALVAPATRITRAIPIPIVADRRGPTAIFPPDEVASEIFNRIGTAIEATSAEQFIVYSTATATMAPYFTMAEEIASWLTRHGVPAPDARRFVAAAFQGLGNIAVASPEHSLAALAGEFATRGGINEQVVAHMKKRGAFAAVSEGLDAVLQRMKNAN